MSWGYRITFVYLGFAAFMIGMVTLCILQDDIFLVEKEYYKEELKYQDKIDKISTASRLRVPIKMEHQGSELVITYPPDAMPSGGDLWLFRPSDARLDKHLTAQASEAGVQAIPLASLKPGLWRVKLDWQSGGKGYFYERELSIPQAN